MPFIPALITIFVNTFTKYENIQGKGNTRPKLENVCTNPLNRKINKLKKIS
jgi:hypothetical protein